ncbi:hypothetical protein OG948_34865 (plasmid) [Embleya sp. NBC_00888]|uniref:hypothetical protein n=1 Tax=Embleya sp. NBC_00888 TaxID=2975960 RepID=UPI002F90CEE1|nr:hypothetical protein OG948_34865 [Embleya sp. NBC_00888]
MVNWSGRLTTSCGLAEFSACPEATRLAVSAWKNSEIARPMSVPALDVPLAHADYVRRTVTAARVRLA